MEKNTKSDPLSRLSRCECEVLKLVVEGRISKEIAVIKGVKLSSIHTYRSRIMAKLEISNDCVNAQVY